MNAVVAPAPSAVTLCCPRCGAAAPGPELLRCAQCDTEYPLVDGMPWLLPDPAVALSAWRARSHALLAHLERQAARYRSSLTTAVTRASTRNRLKLLAGACDDHARRLRSLLAPLEIAAQQANAATYAALGPARAEGQGLAAYYANVHRDWCWGEVENAAALATVRRAARTGGLGRTLVLGAGAGRLAYDLHQSEGATETVAVDVHPLLMLVARRMYDGARLQLYEFPVAPRDLASHALLRTLAAPAPADAGLRLVFADARHLPFGEGTFDTVVTPWFVDVVDADLAELAAVINRVLAQGGRWICTGTLFFEQQRDAAQCYATEEVAEVVEAAGFTAPEFESQAMPYLASPASRHARREEVVTFAVTKWKPAQVQQRDTPRWREDLRSPVPRLPEVDAHTLALRIEAYVASLVDGQHSVADIAARLVQERLLLPQEAVGLVRDFVVRLHEDAGQ